MGKLRPVLPILHPCCRSSISCLTKALLGCKFNSRSSKNGHIGVHGCGLVGRVEVPCIWANSNWVIGTTGLVVMGILAAGALAQGIVEISATWRSRSWVTSGCACWCDIALSSIIIPSFIRNLSWRIGMKRTTIWVMGCGTTMRARP